MNFYVNLSFVLFAHLISEMLGENFDTLKVSENKTPALRTMRDIEQNFIFNELKHASRNYVDEVSVVSYFEYFIPV